MVRYYGATSLFNLDRTNRVRSVINGLNEARARSPYYERFYDTPFDPTFPVADISFFNDGVIRRVELKRHENDYLPVEFFGTRDVPMADWDVPDPRHPDPAITVENLGDVFDRIYRTQAAFGNNRYRLYITPGGFRAFDLSNQMTPTEYFDRMSPDNLDIDPFYRDFARYSRNPIFRYASTPEENDYLGEQVMSGFMPPIRSSSWNFRTSGKPGRPNDWVAFPIANVGRDVPLNPHNVRLVRQYHDNRIAQNLLQNNMNPGILPQQGIEMLESNIPSVENTEHRQSLRRLLDRQLILAEQGNTY